MRFPFSGPKGPNLNKTLHVFCLYCLLLVVFIRFFMHPLSQYHQFYTGERNCGWKWHVKSRNGFICFYRKYLSSFLWNWFLNLKKGKFLAEGCREYSNQKIVPVWTRRGSAARDAACSEDVRWSCTVLWTNGLVVHRGKEAIIAAWINQMQPLSSACTHSPHPSFDISQSFLILFIQLALEQPG